MNHPLPTNLELLVELAAHAGLEYQDAYYVWAQVRSEKEAYLLVESVLYVAKMHKLPVCLALIAYQMTPYWHQKHYLPEWMTA